MAAQGPAPFQPGPATAEAEAVVRDGRQVVDVREWTRTVEIQLGP